MTYFSDFNNIRYDFTINSDSSQQQYILQDMTTRILLQTDSMKTLCDKYQIVANETPEIIAFNKYGDMTLHWVILYINSITNMQTDWPLSDLALKEYALAKYSNVNSIHHYKSVKTGIKGSANDYDSLIAMSGDIADIIPVTNIDYEITLNERKRHILVVKPQFILNFVKQFKAALTK